MLTARRTSVCSRCDRRIEIGDEITGGNGRWYHERCDRPVSAPVDNNRWDTLPPTPDPGYTVPTEDPVTVAAYVGPDWLIGANGEPIDPWYS